MIIKTWNKIDPINGVNAEEVKNIHKINDSHEIFLVIDENSNRVKEIQFKDIICEIYNIDINLSCEEVGVLYLEAIKEQHIKEQNEINNLNDQLAQMKEENKLLREGLAMLLTEEQLNQLGL